jgi:hypothetical protein
VVVPTLSLPVPRLLLWSSLVPCLSSVPLSLGCSLSTLSHHSNFYRCSDSPWATKGATLRKWLSCHPSPLELAPPIVPLLYFLRAPSRPWCGAAAAANGNIGQMVDGQKTVLLPARRRHEPQGTQSSSTCCLGICPPCIRQRVFDDR